MRLHVSMRLLPGKHQMTFHRMGEFSTGLSTAIHSEPVDRFRIAMPIPRHSGRIVAKPRRRGAPHLDGTFTREIVNARGRRRRVWLAGRRTCRGVRRPPHQLRRWTVLRAASSPNGELRRRAVISSRPSTEPTKTARPSPTCFFQYRRKRSASDREEPKRVGT